MWPLSSECRHRFLIPFLFHMLHVMLTKKSIWRNGDSLLLQDNVEITFFWLFSLVDRERSTWTTTYIINYTYLAQHTHTSSIIKDSVLVPFEAVVDTTSLLWRIVSDIRGKSDRRLMAFSYSISSLPRSPLKRLRPCSVLWVRFPKRFEAR
jgi:hypothetical protein